MARTKELVFSGKEGEMGSEGEGLRHHSGVFISAELEPHSVCGLLGSVLWTVARKTASMHDHHLSKVVTICIITGDEIVMTWNEGCNVFKLGVGKGRDV